MVGEREGDIHDRVIGRSRSTEPVGFSEADHARMAELAAKSNRGTLTPIERREFEAYVAVGDLLSTLRAKAKLSGRADPLGSLTPVERTPVLPPTTFKDLLARYELGDRDFAGAELDADPENDLRGVRLDGADLSRSFVVADFRFASLRVLASTGPT